MRLDELIKWAWDNPEKAKSKIFQSNRIDCYGEYIRVQFSVDGHGFYANSVTDKDIFTVEIEEEITEETKFDKLFKMFEPIEGDYESVLYANTSIKECLYGRGVPTKAFYILNDDLTMTLIWKDGELVE
ncbi:TPA: hypothetical protein ACU3NT_001449 [Staphylococcus aureus]